MKRSVEQLLQAGLYRYECPSTLTLSDYQMRLLAKQEQERVVSHVARCPHCQAELQRLEQFLLPDAVASPSWQHALSFIWQNLKEKGTFLVRLLQETQTPLQPLTVAVKGHKRIEKDSEIIRRITLSPEETDDLDLEAIVWRTASASACQITIRVQIPSRWPEMAGVVVRGTAHTWQKVETTNSEGEVLFTDLPEEWVSDLSLEVQT